ncbi:MAG TPA: hypothetical protein ENI61_07235 [Ignavibacteria bacterium]|nr:hypothetical protein [Ignavibacteria bacterium]
MELIPILSTIILVATISTFLLAIGAYILYKVRERKGQQVVTPKPSSVQAELITPVGVPARQPAAGGISPQPRFAREQPAQPYRQSVQQPIFVQQQGPRLTSWQQQKITPEYTPQYAAQEERQPLGTSQPRGYRGPSYAAPAQVAQPERKVKFQQYTSEGYIPAKEDKNRGALKWR